MKMQEILTTHKNEFLIILEEFLKTKKPQNAGEEELLKAISYSLLSKGAKFVRSFIIFEVSKALSGEVCENAKKLAASVEMMHCYSLIHDDLPSMDNSDFRRGEPSLHKKFSESTAILAGNALFSFAFEILSTIKPSEITCKIIFEFAKVSGFEGILSGQVLDLNPGFKKKYFKEMNRAKTSVLFEFCAFAPAILFEKHEMLESLKEYGTEIGLAFQMQDDLLDEEENTFSYTSVFKNKELLFDELKKSVLRSQNSIKHLNSKNLFLLPEYLIQRKN